MTEQAQTMAWAKARRKPLLIGAGVAMAALVAPLLLSTSATGAPSEDKESDDSFVVTWSAPRAGSGGSKGALAAPSAANLEFVSFDAGCRFLDTRVAGGAFAANESRDLGVLDADLPAGIGPCGVPATARAVQVSLSTIGGSPTGKGYARLGQGGVAPTATVLQFGTGDGVSVTTIAPLAAVGKKVRLASLGAGSGYVGDLLGYYQEPITGRISGTGTLLTGTGISSISKSASFAGDYSVTFSRPVDPGCAAVATVDSSSTRVFTYPISSTQWFFDVRVYNTTAESDGTFSLIVQC